MKSVRSVLLAAMLAGGLAVTPVTFAKPPAPPAVVPTVAVGPQYDTTHVCVAPEDFDRFTDSFVATFGGKKSKQGVFQVTPTPSQTMSQLVLTPVGTISVFGFKTPIPYPFCEERTGYLVTDMDVAVKSAREHGADVIVDTFPDPIGRDAIVTWAGGVNMQLYWHTQAPNYDALQTGPENRVYVSPQSVRKFVHDFVKFSKGKVVSDNLKAPGIEIGRPDDTYRRIRIESGFGKMTVLVTDGHLPYPFGREMTGYEVADLAATLKQAEGAGVTVLVPPFKSDGRDAALVQFPGGYVAEIHASVAR
ncbi:VOC family protein [Burkholderia sola]|uniref:VOC family protein n=1 Tax=Burkholderia sola TaxID=2843302 RepID=UPI001C0A886D|nr:lactoylglutathione lyase [Burkholderia cenocepacia]CAG2267988.1 lactoylglutathione lyase [Burkholderia cenocepacia]CAG2268143.1 lactoylglutathione lyase [Burkholderia cenocepacia]CAG2268345.1 lactoylglutathione lyase [Burkholderia cenocepacia]CAG2268409.1 lactoylglutathione lyase [Burkholderia cenocepacia]